MANEKVRLRREIAARLLLLREMRFTNASEMARSIRLTPQAWYNYEKGRRALDASVARAVVETYHVDFNWIFAGSTSSLSRKLAREIAEQLEKPPGPKIKRKKRRKTARAKVETPAKGGDLYTD